MDVYWRDWMMSIKYQIQNIKNAEYKSKSGRIYSRKNWLVIKNYISASGNCVSFCNKNNKSRDYVQKRRLPCAKVTACSAAVQHRFKQEVKGPLTNLTGRYIHTSSQQVSQRAVFSHLLLDRGEENEEKSWIHNPHYTWISLTMEPNCLWRVEMHFNITLKIQMCSCSPETGLLSQLVGFILTVLSGSAADGLISST